jgi:hypothetical protein
MILVLAKVLISPLLLATATFVIHRWGGLVGGLLLGLPLVSGPVSAMLFAQYGSQFAVHAAYGTLLGFVAAGMFCTSYAVVAPRHAWWQSLVAAYATFFTVAGLLSLLHVALGWALVSVPVILVSLAFAIRVPESAHDEPVPRKRILALRMALAGAMVVLITTCAGRLGPVLGSWGGAAFFSVVILLSGSAGPITTYSVATIAAVCVGLFAVGLQTAARSLRVTGLRLPALLVKA